MSLLSQPVLDLLLVIDKCQTNYYFTACEQVETGSNDTHRGE